ncbi:MAG: hypothetical protein AABW84_00990 [Nanoarchaeota archaeon]
MTKITKTLFIASLLLINHILFRLVDYSKVMLGHPLSNIYHDIHSYTPQLFFLKVCGFHQSCPYWYNGIKTFIATPPAWYFFAYPFYIITNNILIAFYITAILIMLFSFLAIYYIGKTKLKSKLKRIAFFAFVFGNNTAMLVLRMDRLPELFSWLFFLISFFVILHYKDKEIDWLFYLLAPMYALTILSYHGVGILLSFIFLGLFLVKLIENKKDAIKVALTGILGISLTSFWSIPLLLEAKNLFISQTNLGAEALWDFVGNYLHFTPMAIIILPLGLFITFYLYLKTNEKTNDLIFVAPSFLLIILFMSGVIKFIPIIKTIFSNIFFIFIIIFISYYLLNIKFEKLNIAFAKLASVLIILLTIGTIAISIHNTPLYDTVTPEQRNVAELLNYVDKQFIVVGGLREINSSHLAIYAYAPIYYNLTTAGGHYPALKDPQYLKDLKALHGNFSVSCEVFSGFSDKLNVGQYIAYGKNCEWLEYCGAKLDKEVGQACLYSK